VKSIDIQAAKAAEAQRDLAVAAVIEKTPGAHREWNKGQKDRRNAKNRVARKSRRHNRKK
jgi:hypothetical protein